MFTRTTQLRYNDRSFLEPLTGGGKERGKEGGKEGRREGKRNVS